ncbi:CDP-alcohol phosphatidyltransferase family protein [Longispora sp. K20-0274]|uniref:CDP-alcohol phosphatidyltransferase family protein n=1 Tax=Longispora sp. K20-0274 TaxID=3088255 RepID=UPI00399AA5E4
MKLREYYALNRGGGLATEGFSQWIGAVSAQLFHRLGLSPTAMSGLNLLLGLVGSGWVLFAAHTGHYHGWIGLAALVLWHVAYGVDCGDGQLARATKTGSPAGARIDVLCDIALQIALVAAVSAVAAEYTPDAPAWLYALFAGTWMVNLVTSVMQQGDTGGSMVTSTSLPVRLVKLIRDYAFVITVLGAVIWLAPRWTIWVIVGFTAINGLFLLASIAFTARSAQRAWAEKTAAQNS